MRNKFLGLVYSFILFSVLRQFTMPCVRIQRMICTKLENNGFYYFKPIYRHEINNMEIA